MPTIRITAKGGVTIPKPIRDQLRLGPGDHVEVSTTSDGAVLLRPKKGRLMDLFGSLPAPSRPLTLDEMEEAIIAGALATME